MSSSLSGMNNLMENKFMVDLINTIVYAFVVINASRCVQLKQHERNVFSWWVGDLSR